MYEKTNPKPKPTIQRFKYWPGAETSKVYHKYLKALHAIDRAKPMEERVLERAINLPDVFKRQFLKPLGYVGEEPVSAL